MRGMHTWLYVMYTFSTIVARESQNGRKVVSGALVQDPDLMVELGGMS